MSDISRQEKINNRIAELEHRIYEKAEEYGNNKWKRVKRTFFVLSGIVYVAAFQIGAIRGSITTYLSWLVIAPIMAGIIMFVSSLVMLYCTSHSKEEEKTLAKMIAELNTIKYFDMDYK